MFTAERATFENDYLALLRAEWEAKVRGYDEDPSSFAVPQLEHAEKIASERPAPKKYGIYVLRDQSGHFHGLFHANVAALPKTTGNTLRVLWFLGSPVYEYEEPTAPDLAVLVSSLLHRSIDLCKSQYANHVKIYLQDKQLKLLAQGIAVGLKDSLPSTTSIAVRGSWLHLDDLVS